MIKHVLTFGILCFVLFTFSCKKQKESASSGSQSAVFTVDGYLINHQPFENRLQVTANLLPAESVEIKSPVAGTVLAIHFSEGQLVQEGQPLIQIDDRIWKAQIKALEAQLHAAREEFQRREALLAAEGASREEVETTRSAVEQLEARIEELSVYVNLASVPAPFSGRVGMRNFSVGAYLNQGTGITQLAQTNPVKVDFSFPGQYIDQIRQGTRIQVISHGDTLTAPVYAVNPVADESARTVQARALLNNVKNWLPGDFTEVLVVLDRRESALVIPTQLIVPDLGRETVFTVENGKVVQKNITTSSRNNKVALVTGGLEEGDTIIATGLVQIREGMTVNLNKISTAL